MIPAWLIAAGHLKIGADELSVTDLTLLGKFRAADGRFEAHCYFQKPEW